MGTGLPPKIKEAPPELVAGVTKLMEEAKARQFKPPAPITEAFIDPNAPKSIEQKEAEARANSRYMNRGEVEMEIVRVKHRDVKLEGEWEGQDYLRVPRWMAWDYFELSDQVARMIVTLFPNNYFFLFYIDHSKIMSATAQVQDILFNKVGQQMVNIIMHTCRIEEERRKEFLQSVTGWDLIEVFLCIVEMNINNDTMRALQKKFRRLLGERFALENVFPDWEDIMAGRQNSVSEVSPTKNSLSFISMQ